MRLHHIAIWTTDLEKMKDFYLKFFDCSASDMYENKIKHFRSYFISFKEGAQGAQIELMNRDDISAQNESLRTGYAHISIDVGSKQAVDKITEVIKSDGYTIESYPRTTGDGYYESVILDPEGNRIEITCVKRS
jgi:lactoylglutathione lyase